jgi:CheY-like chemotaxis protein
LALYLVDILTECRCEICGPAASGRKALEIAGERRPDLALIDIGLKGQMDGISAALELRARFAVPAVFLSGTVDPLILERAQAAAPLDFLHKPYLPAQLESVLRKAFDDL